MMAPVVVLVSKVRVSTTVWDLTLKLLLVACCLLVLLFAFGN